MSRNYDLFGRMMEDIRALPSCSSLLKEDLLNEKFLLHRERLKSGTLDIYYAPFDYVNEDAKVALISVNPGWKQVEMAYRLARHQLGTGVPVKEMLRRVSIDAGITGPARIILIKMLDGLGLQEKLNIKSCSQLFREHDHLMHATSVVRYPVFINGRSYSGYNPGVLEHPALKKYVAETLSEELKATKNALIIPLGKSAARTLQWLIGNGLIERERCLMGFPHPSGANGFRKMQYEQKKEELTGMLKGWFGRQKK